MGMVFSVAISDGLCVMASLATFAVSMASAVAPTALMAERLEMFMVFLYGGSG
jgi:hypothetical protein